MSHPRLQGTMYVSQVCPGLTALLTPDLSKVCGMVIKPSCSVWGQGIHKLYMHSSTTVRMYFRTSSPPVPLMLVENSIQGMMYIHFTRHNHLFTHCQRPFSGTSLTPLVMLAGVSVNSGKPGFSSLFCLVWGHSHG